MNDRRAVAFTGPSNSGKTTLIEKIARKLTPQMRVVIVKHDPKDKASFDREGKDSDKFFKTGAETVVVSPTRTTYFSHRPRELDAIVDMVRDFDLLLLEGLKTWPLPRIGVFRGSVDESYLPYCDALAIDHTVKLEAYEIPSRIDILDLNDIDAVVAWIKTHARPI